MITLTLKMQFNQESDAQAAKAQLMNQIIPGLVTYTEVSIAKKVDFGGVAP